MNGFGKPLLHYVAYAPRPPTLGENQGTFPLILRGALSAFRPLA